MPLCIRTVPYRCAWCLSERAGASWCHQTLRAQKAVVKKLVSDLANRVCPVVTTILECLWQKGKVERHPIVVGILIVVEAVVERVPARHEHTTCRGAAVVRDSAVRSGLQ